MGREIAGGVLARGDRLIAGARDPLAVADLVERDPDRARAVQLDVRDPAHAANAVNAAVAAFGRLDVLVNNAGYANIGAIEETALHDFEAQVDTNLWGVIHATRAALPVMRGQRSGHIIQMSTIGGRKGFPGLAAYTTAKFAVEGFSEALHVEAAPLGVRVTIVEPGAFRTDWNGSSMTVTEPGRDYEPTVGAVIAPIREGRAPGDPAKAAEAILRVADMEDPPRRLALGNDAVELIRAVHHDELRELARWESISRSTDHADAEAVDLGSLAAG
jgi:NAD(P)-dependent dehydrogenase (short-subunit alcohol dehydrogenase family)